MCRAACQATRALWHIYVNHGYRQSRSLVGLAAWRPQLACAAPQHSASCTRNSSTTVLSASGSARECHVAYRRPSVNTGTDVCCFHSCSEPGTQHEYLLTFADSTLYAGRGRLCFPHFRVLLDQELTKLIHRTDFGAFLPLSSF